MREQDSSGAKLRQFEALCRERGLPLTVQRRAVLVALMRHSDHPTADHIFDEVSGRFPGISRTTVYRVLETLVRLGVARKVCHPEAAARFETDTDRHHHMVCLECGRMVDLRDPRLDSLPFPDARSQGFKLTDYSIQFRGTCADCAQRAAKPRKTQMRGKPHETKK